MFLCHKFDFHGSINTCYVDFVHKFMFQYLTGGYSFNYIMPTLLPWKWLKTNNFTIEQAVYCCCHSNYNSWFSNWTLNRADFCHLSARYLWFLFASVGILFASFCNFRLMCELIVHVYAGFVVYTLRTSLAETAGSIQTPFQRCWGRNIV